MLRAKTSIKIDGKFYEAGSEVPEEIKDHPDFARLVKGGALEEVTELVSAPAIEEIERAPKEEVAEALGVKPKVAKPKRSRRIGLKRKRAKKE